MKDDRLSALFRIMNEDIRTSLCTIHLAANLIENIRSDDAELLNTISQILDCIDDITNAIEVFDSKTRSKN